MFKACKPYVKPMDIIVLGVVMALPMVLAKQPAAASLLLGLIAPAG